MTVQLIYDHIAHHAGHSGYDQMLRYLRGHVQCGQLHRAHRNRISEWIWQRMINHAGVGWYSRESCSLETEAAFRILRGRREIYHYLYGDGSYRYLGYVRRMISRKRGALVASYHQPPEQFEKVVTYRNMLKDLDAIVLMSGNQVPCFSSYAGRQTKVRVIPHGIDTEYYKPALFRREARGITCLCVGQWLRDFEMLRAVADCVAARDHGIRFLVVGSGPAGELLKKSGNVELSGRLPDEEFLDVYQQADIMVLPLLDSTANNALLEGIACGLPLVSTDNGGSRDYVDDSCASLLLSGDADGMADVILRLAADETLRGTMALAARRRALCFSWERVIEPLIDLYLEVSE